MAPNRRQGTPPSPPAQARPPRVPKPLPNARLGRRTNRAPRYKSPSKVFCDMRRLQSTTSLLIPVLAFGRLVREITVDVTRCNEVRYQMSALRALHEAAEAHIVGMMEDSYLCTLHAKRVTLMAKDMRLAYRIRRYDVTIGL